MVSMLLPVLVALSGLGLYIHGLIIEPNFDDGRCYSNAWIEYGNEQNILHVEFIPDYNGSALRSMGEALCRVSEKMNINSKIDNKPILVIGSVRYKTELLEAYRVVIQHDDYAGFCDASMAERREIIHKLEETVEITYNKDTIMIINQNKLYFTEMKNLSAAEWLHELEVNWE